jgi:hypothetical protein
MRVTAMFLQSAQHFSANGMKNIVWAFNQVTA